MTERPVDVKGYETCSACCFGRHAECDEFSRIYHVGSYEPKLVPCRCWQKNHADD